MVLWRPECGPVSSVREGGGISGYCHLITWLTLPNPCAPRKEIFLSFLLGEETKAQKS